MILYLWAKFCSKIRGAAVSNSCIHKKSRVGAGSRIVNSKIDRFSYCSYDCTICDCEIGSFCSIADNVKIGGAMHPISWVSTSAAFYSGRNNGLNFKISNHDREPSLKTLIGNDVWIGASAIVKQGVTIGNGAVIGMGSVVTKDVPPYTIVAGNPAKIIRKRFDDNICEMLNDSEWWNFSDEKLLTLSEYIKSPKIFLEKII